ncbi:hypothetical protein ASPCAL11251 [Aspergillus calidoustus]|uniref:Nudix hydrolase domain-containing protein n=1 Tax=Aspergillus calidoustus TaxID=454130 RepID=A0A0U5G7F9_ASPCI|nr:hypothetical protein ASPCAL11251 [Aspergillus calidoustus]
MATGARHLFFLLAPPVIGGYAVHRGISNLESRYPRLPVDDSTSSLEFRTPSSPSTQHSPHIDIYAARIPLKALLARTDNPSEITTADNATLSTTWARSVFGSRLFRFEGSVIGFFTERKFNPGDIGGTPDAFNPIPVIPGTDSNSEPSEQVTEIKRPLLHGIFIVERPPSPDSPHGLLGSWKMSDEPREFFEKIARWGYPWRLMSGGRHELSVSEPYEVPGLEGEGPFVDVRFASAHDYEVVPEEGGLDKQKTIPEWSARMHRGYAMLILDVAVRELMRK